MSDQRSLPDRDVTDGADEGWKYYEVSFFRKNDLRRKKAFRHNRRKIRRHIIAMGINNVDVTVSPNNDRYAHGRRLEIGVEIFVDTKMEIDCINNKRLFLYEMAEMSRVFHKEDMRKGGMRKYLQNMKFTDYINDFLSYILSYGEETEFITMTWQVNIDRILLKESINETGKTEDKIISGGHGLKNRIKYELTRDKLNEMEIVRLDAEYSGSADDGQVDNLSYVGAKGEIVTCPPPWMRKGDEDALIDPALYDAVRDVFYDLLAQNYGGWEIEEGSFGAFVWDVLGDEMRVSHTYRFIDRKERVL